VGTPDLSIYANDVDDAAAFSSPGNRVSAITKTTASAPITGASWNPAADNAISVTSIVAEIIARAGWVTNNDIAFGIFNNTLSGSHYIGFAALDHASLTEPRLSIDYSVAATSFPPQPNQPPMQTLLRR